MSSIQVPSRSLIVLLLILFSLSPQLQAHEIRPAIVDLDLQQSGRYEMAIRLNLESLIAQIGPLHKNTNESANAAEYGRLRELPPADLGRRFSDFSATLLSGIKLVADGTRLTPAITDIAIPQVGDTALARDSVIHLAGQLPADTGTLTWRWNDAFGAAIVRVTNADGSDGYADYLLAGKLSKPIPVEGVLVQSGWEVFRNYVVIGFQHILPKGLDHILFVVGLFLLNARLRSLLLQITSFTVAHTVTLALGVYGVVDISPSIVEPLIAASIVYVCVENIFSDHLSYWRPLVVFIFGLLHGLGFAGVLTEIGLQPAHFATGLIAFNIGVELGQLTVISGCFLAVGLWFHHRQWYRSHITVPASLVIALIGSYWLLQRTLFDQLSL